MKKGVLLLLWAVLTGFLGFSQVGQPPAIQWSKDFNRANGTVRLQAKKSPQGILLSSFSLFSGQTLNGYRTSATINLEKYNDNITSDWLKILYSCQGPGNGGCDIRNYDTVPTRDGGAIVISQGIEKFNQFGNNIWRFNTILNVTKVVESAFGEFYLYKSPNKIYVIDAGGREIYQTFTLPDSSFRDMFPTKDGGLVYTGSKGTYKIRSSNAWVDGLYADFIRQTEEGAYIAWGNNGIVKLNESGKQDWQYNSPGINAVITASKNTIVLITDSKIIKFDSGGKIIFIKNSGGKQVIETNDNHFVVVGLDYLLRKFDGESGDLVWEITTPIFNGPLPPAYGNENPYGIVKADDKGFFAWSFRSNELTQLQKYAADLCTIAATISATPTTLCQGRSVTLNANTGPNLTYQWKRDGQNLDGITGNSYAATLKGNYTVTVTNQNGGCSATSSAVEVVSSDLKYEINVPSDYCAGNNITLTATVTGGKEPYSFQWSEANGSSSNAPSFTVSTTGSNQRLRFIRLIVQDINNCARKDTVISFLENFKLVANAGPDVFRTGTEKYTIPGATATGGTPGYTYAWSSGPTVTVDNAGLSNPTFGPFTSPSTNLKLTVTDSKGCQAEARAQVVFTVCTFEARILSKGFFCTGGADTLTTQLTGGSGGYRYLWSREGGEALSDESRLLVTQSGVYALSVSDSKGCRAIAARMTVAESPRPAVSISGADSFCKGGSTPLSANATGGIASYTFQWKLNNAVTSSNAVLTATAAGTYTVAATDSRGCASPTATLPVREKGGDLTALISPAGATDVLSPATVTLNANGGLGLAYQWRKDGQDIAGATAVSYVVNQTGTASYSVTVSRDGCSVASPPVTVVINVPTALEPLAREAFELRVFPNPTSGLLRVEIHLARRESLRLSIQDLTGRILTEEQRSSLQLQHEFELNLSALANGLYLLSAESESGRQSRKVLKAN